MADVKLSHVYKVYDGNVKAVSDFNIDIKDKEFIVFVGPSGCGKSTTLRMIAGLEDITAGDLFIQDQLVNDVQPKDRDIAMVFQNYALYPHMTVYDNMAFSLKNRHLPKEEINRRVLEAARILDIEDFLQRKPKAMSGGQRQRVSLGRAIVRQPKVFLLDEPLSNLDAKLRAQMRTEIAKLHKKLQTTFIYVTHDQVEAMTMGTRIVVMKLGFVQQIDTPTNLYNHPVNKFVAGFIGTPQMNFFDVTLLRDKQNVTITFEDKQQLTMSMLNFFKANPKYLKNDIHLTLGVRPDGLLVTKGKGLELIVSEIEALGNETLLYCDLAHAVIKDKEKIGKSSIIVKVDSQSTYSIGDKIKVVLADNKIHLFDNDTEQTVMPYIPNSAYQTISFKGDKYTIFGKTYKRFSAWRDIKDGENYSIEIPHSAIVPGKAFSLKVASCEKIDEKKYLVILHNDVDDSYLSVVTEKEFAVNDDFNFGLKYAELILDPKLNCPPVKKECSILGTFEKVKEIDDRDYKLVSRKLKSEKEKFNVEKAISKFYLSSEEFGANKQVHETVKSLVKQKLESSEVDIQKLLATSDSLREEIKKLQTFKEYNESYYVQKKQELLANDLLICNASNLAYLNSLKEAKLQYKEFDKLNEEDKKACIANIEEIVSMFNKETEVCLQNITQEAQMIHKPKALQKLRAKLERTFYSHRLFGDKDVIKYFKDKIENYKETEKYVRLMKQTPSEIFSDNPPSDVSSAEVSNANIKLYHEILEKYLLTISATESYVRGLFLGNSTRWHKQANNNADELFESYNKLHDLIVSDFELCDKVKTSDFKLRKIHNFYINICNTKFRLSDDMVVRLNNIEGSKLLKNKYRFVINPIVKNLLKPSVKAVQENNFDGKVLTSDKQKTAVMSKLPDPNVVVEDMSTTEIRQITKADIDAKIENVQDNTNIKHKLLSIVNYDVHTFARVEFLPDFITEENKDKYERQYADIEITGLDVADDYYISADVNSGFEIFTLDSKIRIV